MIAKVESWTLIDGDARHVVHPETWEMPDQAERQNLKVGAIVKVGFMFPLPEGGERLWYRVAKVNEDRTFDLERMNTPLGPCPEKVTVETKHILSIWEGPMPD